jgi:CheY-like chemotaxis protein
MPIDIIKKSSASSKKVSQKKKTILIVEDDPLSAKLLDKIFENSNYNIEHVGDGPDAIEFLKTAKSDIVLMDIKLPSLSGFKTVEEIRKFNKSIPIIAQTANAIYNDREKAREVGFTDYLLKPIDAEELLNIIKKYS